MPAARLLPVALAAVLAACAVPAGPAPSDAATISSREPASPQVAATTPADSGALPAASLAVNPDPAASGPSPAAGIPEPPVVALPPAGILLTAAGDEIRGILGSWTFENSGSDSPWLSAAGLPGVRAVAGSRLRVRLAGGQPIGAWSARAAAATDTRGERPIDMGAREVSEPPLDELTLDVLPPGRWVLAVRLELADGRGDVTCYWLVSTA